MSNRKKIMPLLQVQWQGAFEGYARKWVNSHYWRVVYTIGSREDAMQEAALIFVRCYNHYCWTVDNPRWFMSLYKIALVNDWNTLAQRDGNTRAIIPPDAIDRFEAPIAMLALRIRESSAEMQHVLGMLADAPADLLMILFGSPSPTLTNRRLCRFAGIKYGVADICSELRALLA